MLQKKSFHKQQNRPQILPQNLVQHFYHSFSTYGLLLHFHSVSKNRQNTPITMTYNFSAFLTLDKSRKIIRKKEDEFVAEITQKIEVQVKKFMSRHCDEKELYKITYAELQKFIQLFESRKSQFSYFQKSLKQIQRALKLGQKQKHKDEQTIRRMKDMMDEFHEKLILVLEKYEEKTHMSLLGRLKMKMKILRKFSDEKENVCRSNHIDAHQEENRQKSRHMMGIYKIQSQISSQNTLQRSKVKRSASKNKTRIVNKYGDVSVQDQKIQSLKRQINNLKSKYYKMNCKTQTSKCSLQAKQIILRKCASRTHTMMTNVQSEGDNCNTVTKDQETNASEVKYSIRLTQQRKQSKMNSSSFSIFDKTHHASFIMKNPSKLMYDGKAVIMDENQATQKSIPGEFLRKRSSLFKNSVGKVDGYFQKKPNNSVYRQTNFAVETQQRTHQKRVSTAKPRQSIRRDTQHKQYMLRTSQTEANIEEDFNREEDINFDVEENDEEVLPVEDVQEVEQFEEDANEEEMNLRLRQKEKKLNNRRKRFSKHKITTESDVDSSCAPSAVNIKRNSQVWNDNMKQQKSYNRTSFFRTSGYTPKKSMMKPMKTRFNNLSKKLYRKDSKDMSSQALIEQVQTQKTIRSKGLQRGVKKRMRTHEMAVTAMDCKQLYEEISGQKRLDEMGLHPSYLLTMMRQKYDLKFKLIQEEDQDDENQNPFRKQRLMMMETENDEEEDVGKWTRGKNSNGEIQFMRIASRKFNELGQKNLQLSAYNWQNDLQCINL